MYKCINLDGSFHTARFFSPMHVVVDAFDNIIVADTDNQAVRVMLPAVAPELAGATVATLAGFVACAGRSTDACAHFAKPTWLYLDHAGVLYVLEDANLSHIRRIEYASAPGGWHTRPAQAQRTCDLLAKCAA